MDNDIQVFENEIQYIKSLTPQEQVARGLAVIDNEINKRYMYELEDGLVVPLDQKEIISSRESIELLKIDTIVFSKGENVNQKLTSVFNSLHHFGTTLMVYLHGTKNGIELFFGVKSKERNLAVNILKRSLAGNFPGSKISHLTNRKKIEFLEKHIPFDDRYCMKTIATVYAVPSLQDSNCDTEEGYVQGIEKFIDTMAGNEYTALFICEPINRNLLQKHKRDLEKFYTDLSLIDEFDLTYGEAVSKAEGMTDGESITKTFATSISNTIGDSTSISHGESSGYQNPGGDNWSSSTTEVKSNSKAHQTGKTESRADGKSTAKTITDTTGSSKTYSSTVEIKPVIEYMKKIEGLLSRIEKAESYGMWNTAGYFISNDASVSRICASVHKSLALGANSHLDQSFSNVWSWDDNDAHKQEQIFYLLKYLHCGLHPEFRDNSIIYTNKGKDFKRTFIKASNLINGSELPIFVGFPRKSVAGITVLSYAEFGRNVNKSESNDTRKFNLGCMYHMGQEFRNEVVEMTVNSLDKHCFICGATGSGKSNTVYHMLKNLVEQEYADYAKADYKKKEPYKDVKFLVVEPTKGEYGAEFGALPGINIFTTNPRFHELLKLNPFYFPDGIHVLEHLDRLIEIFNACWPLYAAMPAVLKESFERAYQEVGWDLKNSEYLYGENKKYPTFNTVLEQLGLILEASDFGAEAKGNYKGALETRVKSLTNGITGLIFPNGNGIDDDILFNQNTIIDISRVGSDETKSLIMGIVILKLNEFRMCEVKGINLPLRHVTVLEEAHHLLKRVSQGQGQESSNVAGKSVEMLTNSIAEMRTYGESFIIVDQTPSAVADSAIYNTGTKIIMGLASFVDCETMGKSVSLDDDQIREISRLGKGVAIVFQSDWAEPVLCKIHEYKHNYFTEKTVIRDSSAVRESCARLAVKAIELWKANDIAGLQELHLDIETLNIPASDISRYKDLLQRLCENPNLRYTVASFVAIMIDGAYIVEMFRHILPQKLQIKTNENGTPALTEDGNTQYDFNKVILDKLSNYCAAIYKYIHSVCKIEDELVYDCIFCILFSFVCNSKSNSERVVRECCYKLYTNYDKIKKSKDVFLAIEKERVI